jgi:hypothetical protein
MDLQGAKLALTRLSFCAKEFNQTNIAPVVCLYIGPPSAVIINL